MTAEEIAAEIYILMDSFDKSVANIKDHTRQALTAYRTDILSAIERGEDIMKLDLGKYNL